MPSKVSSVNFLRGVPADEALERLVPMAAAGYADVIGRLGTGVLQYGHFLGFGPLREILGAMHAVAPGRVIVGNGGMEVISLFFKALPRQSTILIEQSTYDRVITDALRYGHRLVGVPLAAGGLDLERLQDLATRTGAAAFYGIPFHHNPTGITYTVENRRAVEAACRAHGLFCVWDICYEALRYDGESNIPIQLDGWGPVLMNSFTKTISPGTKCGYMVVPEALVPELENVIANTRLNPNLPTQAFVADFIASGRYDGYLTDLRNLYRPRMEALNQSLAAHFPGAAGPPVSGGFFAALRLAGLDGDGEEALIAAAKTAGVGIAAAWGAVAPDCREALRSDGMFVRLTFPAAEPEAIAWGLETLHRLVK